jgi:hypothetical protein
MLQHVALWINRNPWKNIDFKQCLIVVIFNYKTLGFYGVKRCFLKNPCSDIGNRVCISQLSRAIKNALFKRNV